MNILAVALDKPEAECEADLNAAFGGDESLLQAAGDALSLELRMGGSRQKPDLDDTVTINEDAPAAEGHGTLIGPY